MLTNIGSPELTAITDDIWMSMVGMQLNPSEDERPIDKTGGCVVASVQIVSTADYAVRLDLDLGLARQAAANLFGIDQAELSTDDIRDAAGELANMTGGSIKGLLPDAATISLPSVVIGTEYEFTIPHGATVLKSAFTADSGRLLLTLIERQN